MKIDSSIIFVFPFCNLTTKTMVYEKRRFFGVFSPWDFTVRNNQVPILFLVILIILLALIIALICDYYAELFRCQHPSPSPAQSDPEITQ